MALLRDIWDEIQSRIENDDKFRNYFSQLENAIKTEKVNTNYFRMVPGILGPSQVASASGNPPQMGLDFSINLLMIIFSNDPVTIFDQYLRGVEIFMNAMFKKDVIFGNKLTEVPTVTFEPVSAVTNSAGFVIEAGGEMTFQLQKFLGGTL